MVVAWVCAFMLLCAFCVVPLVCAVCLSFGSGCLVVVVSSCLFVKFLRIVLLGRFCVLLVLAFSFLCMCVAVLGYALFGLAYVCCGYVL